MGEIQRYDAISELDFQLYTAGKDINADGVIDGTDQVLVAEHFKALDANGDGRLSAADVDKYEMSKSGPIKTLVMSGKLAHVSTDFNYAGTAYSMALSVQQKSQNSHTANAVASATYNLANLKWDKGEYAHAANLFDRLRMTDGELNGDYNAHLSYGSVQLEHFEGLLESGKPGKIDVTHSHNGMHVKPHAYSLLLEALKAFKHVHSAIGSPPEQKRVATLGIARFKATCLDFAQELQAATMAPFGDVPVDVKTRAIRRATGIETDADIENFGYTPSQWNLSWVNWVLILSNTLNPSGSD